MLITDKALDPESAGHLIKQMASEAAAAAPLRGLWHNLAYQVDGDILTIAVACEGNAKSARISIQLCPKKLLHWRIANGHVRVPVDAWLPLITTTKEIANVGENLQLQADPGPDGQGREGVPPPLRPRRPARLRRAPGAEGLERADQ
jgi:hypothetical protein